MGFILNYKIITIFAVNHCGKKANGMLHVHREPTVSIIIPYFNHGKYITDTVASIDRIADKNLYEIIIVNDGSTDPYSVEVIEKLAETGLYHVVMQPNQGVCAARNTALKHVRGKYILPVDSDNAIKEAFVYKALEILEKNPDIAVVYSDSELMGEETGIRVAGPFNLQRLMLDNFIDNCSVYRSSMIAEIGDYDTFKPISGIEDWEFWLRAAFKGYKFHYIPEPLFQYRILSGSLAHKLNASKIRGNINMDHFREKHPYYFGPQYVDRYFLNKFKSSPLGFIGKLILKVYFPKMFERLVKKGSLRKYI